MAGLQFIHLDPVSRESASLEIAVDLVEALGADSLVHGQLVGGREAPAMTVRVEGAMRVAAGDTLHLALALERVHLFDAGDGRRVV